MCWALLPRSCCGHQALAGSRKPLHPIFKVRPHRHSPQPSPQLPAFPSVCSCVAQEWPLWAALQLTVRQTERLRPPRPLSSWGPSCSLTSCLQTPATSGTVTASSVGVLAHSRSYNKTPGATRLRSCSRTFPQCGLQLCPGGCTGSTRAVWKLN